MCVYALKFYQTIPNLVVFRCSCIIKKCEFLVLCRFGGLSYGEVNEMAQLNSTEVKSFFDELAVASDGDSVSTQDSVLSGITDNIADLLNDMVTKENGKVTSGCTLLYNWPWFFWVCPIQHVTSTGASYFPILCICLLKVLL